MTVASLLIGGIGMLLLVIGGLLFYKRNPFASRGTVCHKRTVYKTTLGKRPHAIIVFDTDTTGLVVTQPHHTPQEPPYLVQLSWSVFDATGKRLKTSHRLIADVTEMPPAAYHIHGISVEQLRQEGLPLKEVLSEFLGDIDGDSLLVAHNYAFDNYILTSAMRQAQLPLHQIQSFAYRKGAYYCTMVGTQALCCLRGNAEEGRQPNERYKYPSLTELHEYLFATSGVPSGAIPHNASRDLERCERCFWELVKRGYIVLRTQRRSRSR